MREENRRTKFTRLSDANSSCACRETSLIQLPERFTRIRGELCGRIEGERLGEGSASAILLQVVLRHAEMVKSVRLARQFLRGACEQAGRFAVIAPAIGNLAEEIRDLRVVWQLLTNLCSESGSSIVVGELLPKEQG